MAGIVAKRYAHALFELAAEAEAVESVHRELDELTELLAQSEEWLQFVEVHTLGGDDRWQALQAMLGERVQQLTLNFLGLLDSKGRLALLPEIAEVFDAMSLEHMNLARATVISASSLEEAQLQRLCERLQRRFGKRIEASTRVDPDLLGGFVVRIGDTVLDYSIQHHLEELRQRIMTA